MNSIAKFLCLWQPKFCSKNKLMIAQLIKQLPIKNKKKKTKLIKQLDPIVKDIIS